MLKGITVGCGFFGNIHLEGWSRIENACIVAVVDRDEERAKDAMQEVFAKVLRHRERLKHQYPSSLLFRISTNTCLNMLREERSRAALSGDNVLAGIAAFDEWEERVIIRDILDRIFRRERQSTREIAVMHFVDGMTLQEVADEVGLSLSGVRKRIRDFRERVKTKKEIYYES